MVRLKADTTYGSSEREARRDLHDPGVARQARDRSEGRRIADVAVRQPEVDGVEDVEDVPAQRGGEALPEVDAPLDRQVDVLEARAGEPVAQLVAEDARRHRREGGDV